MTITQAKNLSLIASMAASHYFILTFLFCFPLIFGQNQEGFISIDCGVPPNSAYTEPASTINYVSDAAFIDTGRVHNISTVHPTDDLGQQLRTLRSFPEGIRNCYRVEVIAGTKYIIRVSFLYGNYDGKNKLPRFELYLGASFWDTIDFQQINEVVNKEVIHMVSSNHVEICVVNNGNGIPFVSALEFRPFKNVTYRFVEDGSQSLIKFLRLDIGSNNKTYRFKDDVYDRIWESPDHVPTNFFSYQPNSWTTLQTLVQPDVNKNRSLIPPPVVMSTVAMPKNSTNALEFSWTHPDKSANFCIVMYFCEPQEDRENRSREFKIFINNKLWHWKTVIVPSYLNVLYIFSSRSIRAENGTCNVSLKQTNTSMLPPILNALEVYTVTNFLQLETNDEEVEAMKLIKEKYGVGRNWEGDPCSPQEFIWEGLNCGSYGSGQKCLRIKSLNLSSSRLRGEIIHHIANLKMLEILDLSNNNLSGQVPDWCTQLPLLRVLKLENNNLSGGIPSQLIEKSHNGSLSLSFDENLNLIPQVPSRKKETNIAIPIATSIGGLVILLFLIGTLFFFKVKRRKQGGAESDQWQTTKRPYSYLDIVRITNNFESIIGVGGFGKVYYGRTENIEVAVKMLSSSSTQGHTQFEAEVDLLVRVHHKNLTNLVGYCNEATHKGLVYEYMNRGNLRFLLSNVPDTLNWKDRLHIALGAAQGLEYLHYGIKPAIIHRDVKSSNILLNDKNEVKVSDFGLSRISPTESGKSHTTTVHIVGTRGYIDPEYYTSHKLDEKSDVYSYGVVLLEIVTGRVVFKEEEDEITHIRQWVDSKLSQSDINSIVDQKMQQDFNVNSIWKAVEIAMSCTAESHTSRPNMSQVMGELKECLVMELSQDKSCQSESIVFDDSSILSPR